VTAQTISQSELQQWRSTALQQATQLNRTNPADFRVELDWLLQVVAGLDRLSLRLLSPAETAPIKLLMPLAELTRLWQCRVRENVPVQYLAGVAGWRHFSLTVSPAVLIPRPETELLIDLAMAAVKAIGGDLDQGHWADLGTGSGAIALALAEGFPTASIHAVDCSAPALAIAQHNAKDLELAQRIQFYQGSWLEPLTTLKGKLSGVVSNPPYIPTQAIPDLQPEVALHEPRVALDGGVDGLDCIRHLIATAPSYLQPHGVLLLEMMAGQAQSVAALLQQSGHYYNIQIRPDLAGIARFAVAHRL